MDSITTCSECGAALIEVEEIGRVFERCPTLSCEERRERRRSLQTRNYHQNAGGPQQKPPRKSIEELQRYYLDPDGAGFQEAIAEAQGILEANCWSYSAFLAAVEWTGLPITRLRVAVRRPPRRRRILIPVVPLAEPTGKRAAAS